MTNNEIKKEVERLTKEKYNKGIELDREKYKILNEYEDRINKVRDKCKHKFIPDGYDSHYDWVKCTNCGYSKQDR